MSSFGEHESVLVEYLSTELREVLPAVAEELHSVRIPTVAELEEAGGTVGLSGHEQDRARQVSSARRAFKRALRETKLDQTASFAASGLGHLEVVNTILQRREFGVADLHLNGIPDPLEGLSVPAPATMRRAFHAQPISYMGLRKTVNPHIETEEIILRPVRMTLPAYPADAPVLDDEQLRQLHRALMFLTETPERAFRLGLLRAEISRGLDELDDASTQYRAVLEELPAEMLAERRLTALRLGATELARGDRMFRSMSESTDVIAGVYDSAIATVERSDLMIDAGDASRHRIVLSARIQRDKLAAGLNALGYHATFVPPNGPERLKERAGDRLVAAASAARLFEEFKRRADEIDTYLKGEEFALDLAQATREVDADKVDVANLEHGIANLQIDAVQQEIEAQDQAFGMGLGQALLSSLTASLIGGPGAGAAQAAMFLPGLVSSGMLFQSRRDGLGLQKAIAENRARITAKNVELAKAEQQLTAVRIAFLQARIATLQAGHLSSDLYFSASEIFRELAQRHLETATRWAFLFDRAVAFRNFSEAPPSIRLDYADNDILGTGAATLGAALEDVVDSALPGHMERISEKYSLRALYPLEFARFRQSGKMDFTFSLPWFDARRPGSYRTKIEYVAVQVVGLIPPTGYTGEITHMGTFLVRDDRTTPEPGMGRLVPTDDELAAALADAERIEPVAGVIPYCLKAAPYSISPEMPLPINGTPPVLPPGSLIPIEGYGPAGSWSLTVRGMEPRAISDVLLHVLYFSPPIDLDLKRRVTGLLASYEAEQLAGEAPDAIMAVSMRRTFEGALANLMAGTAQLVLQPSLFAESPPDVRLKTIVVQALDRDAKGVVGVELAISRAEHRFELVRTTDPDGFTEPAGEIVVLPC